MNRDVHPRIAIPMFCLGMALWVNIIVGDHTPCYVRLLGVFIVMIITNRMTIFWLMDDDE